ncbi:MAG: hypothetical protein JXA21_02285 [Anaerolineae bacterium]|nr:hypothetical protein [Anaerolineae bacterium]
MEEEIDLRVYIDVLLRWWWLIALSVVVVGGAAYGISATMTPMYEATAGVVSLKSRAEISLGSGFESLSEDDLSSTSASSVVLDRNKRRLNTLTGMVRNGAIAEQVALELQDLLAEEERDPAYLVAHVQGEVLNVEDSGESDTIQIVVTHPDPRKAAAIANAWAKAFEMHVNGIYGEAAYSPFSDIHQQVVDAKTAYDQAQSTWLAFLADDNRIGELQRQVNEEETMIDYLRKGRQFSLGSVITQQVSIQQRLFDVTVFAEINTHLLGFEKQRDKLLYDLEHGYGRKLELANLADDARMMREALLTGGDANARTNTLILMAFKSGIFTPTHSLPFGTVDITLPSADALTPAISAEEQLADVNAILTAIESEIARLDTELQAQATALAKGESYAFLEDLTPESLTMAQMPSGEALQRMAGWEGVFAQAALLNAPLDQEIAQREAHVRGLRAEIAGLDGRKQEVQQNRDLAWSAYQNLLSKEQEITIATIAAGSDVRFASPAVPPLDPVSPKKLMNTAVGLAAGGMLGVFCSYLFDYIGLDSNPRRFLRRKKPVA